MIRTKQLAEPILGPAFGIVNVYTVPAGKTALIKLVTAFNAGVLGDQFALSWIGSGAVARGFYVSPVVGGAASAQWPPLTAPQGFLVLKAGDILRISTFALTVWHFGVHGAELEGVA